MPEAVARHCVEASPVQLSISLTEQLQEKDPVPPAGFEPAIFCVKACCSVSRSYKLRLSRAAPPILPAGCDARCRRPICRRNLRRCAGGKRQGFTRRLPGTVAHVWGQQSLPSTITVPLHVPGSAVPTAQALDTSHAAQVPARLSGDLGSIPDLRRRRRRGMRQWRHRD